MYDENGVYDENGDEVPKAFVVRGDVAPYKKVRRVEFVEAIPKAASGQIVRRELREQEKASAPRAAPLPAPPS